MVKLNGPKRATLPNGTTFVALYKRINRDQLPPNRVMRRTYTQRAASRGCRRQVRAAQQGQGIFDFVKKVVRNPTVKSIARQGLKYVLDACANLTKKVKNKTLKRFLNSHLAHSMLNKAIRTENIPFKMRKGLSNFQIDDFYKDEENDDLKNNYMGTYSIDSISKYINFYEIIKKRNTKYPFAIFNTDKENQPGIH